MNFEEKNKTSVFPGNNKNSILQALINYCEMQHDINNLYDTHLYDFPFAL